MAQRRRAVCKFLVFSVVYAGIFIFGLIQGQGQNIPFDIAQGNINTENLRCIGKWSAKPVWTLTYDASRSILFPDPRGCVCMLDMSDPSRPKKISDALYASDVGEENGACRCNNQSV